MAKDVTTPKVDALEAENAGFRRMLVQGGIGASQLLAKAGINATEQGCRAFAAPIVWKECTIDRVKNTVFYEDSFVPSIQRSVFANSLSCSCA